MNFNKTGCCAIQEIVQLSGHIDPLTAMESFCKQNFAAPPRFGGAIARNDALYSFYLFTAALGGYNRAYGEQFATFIEEHKLGEVWASPAIRNNAFHEDHANQVWIWMPDVKHLRVWWNAHIKAAATPPPKPTPKPRVKKVSLKCPNCFEVIVKGECDCVGGMDERYDD